MQQAITEAIRGQASRGQAAPDSSQGATLQRPGAPLVPLKSPPKGKTMKIKKFVGGSMSECLLKVKRELGEDAVILDSRKIPRGGPFSFLLTDQIEVVASIDAEPRASFSRPLGRGGYSDPSSRAKKEAGENIPLDLSQQATSKFPPASKLEPVRVGEQNMTRRVQAKGARKAPAEGAPAPESMQLRREWVSAAEFALISDDLRGLKETLGQITDHLKFRQLPSLPEELEFLHRTLLENGVEDRVAAGLTQEMALRLSGGEFEDRALLRRVLHEGIGNIVKAAPLKNEPSAGRIKTRDLHSREHQQNSSVLSRAGHGQILNRASSATGYRGRPRVIALVGPTGVGKTTTLAKMATHTGLFGRTRVGLVSADTYRIAAVEQLKTFATIAKLEMEAVYRPADMGHAIERMAGCDAVLIDTAGRSPNDGTQLQDLSAFLEYAGVDEVHLVLAMGTRLEDQLGIIEKFALVKPSRLIFTKLDETTSWGSVLNVCAGMKAQAALPLPISLLTWGQDVPDDIISPTQIQLTRLVSEQGYYQELRNRN